MLRFTRTDVSPAEAGDEGRRDRYRPCPVTAGTEVRRDGETGARTLPGVDGSAAAACRPGVARKEPPAGTPEDEQGGLRAGRSRGRVRTVRMLRPRLMGARRGEAWPRVMGRLERRWCVVESAIPRERYGG